MEALRLYRQALRECPSAPPEVRLGLAACYFRLGDTLKAEAAYRRVLELNPNSVQALLGLAVLTLAVGAGSEATRDGSRLLARAFEEDPHDPHVLILLAHFSLQQGLAEHARAFAQATFDSLSVDEVELKAQALCLLARAHHALGSMSDAVKHYTQALSLDKTLPSARLAVAQVHLLRGEMQNAMTALQQVLGDRPAWVDALRLLAPLCPRQSTVAAVAAPARHFKTAAERAPEDPEIWQMLADVIAGADPSGALAASMKALAIYRKQLGKEQSIPARLLNNAAVLQLRAGAASVALQLMNEAMSSAAAGGLQELGPQAQVTLGFNLARIHESLGNLKTAEMEYRAILSQFPQYADCHIRLALIAKQRGDFERAEDAARAAAAVPGKEVDALAILAGLHLDRKDIAATSKCLEDMEKALVARVHGGSSPSSALRSESFLKIARGNVYLASVPTDIYKVLQDDSSNIAAANGIGCVLAEAGWLKEAQEIFLRIQESIAGSESFSDFPDVWINLGSALLGLHECTAAEQTYANAMKRFPQLSRDPRCLLYLAKAMIDGENLKSARRVLSKAIHLEPRDPRLRFNAAYVLQKSAERVLAKPTGANETAIAQSLSEAVLNLKTSNALFQMLRNVGHEKTGLSDRNLDHHIVFTAKQHDHGKKMAAQAAERAKTAMLRLQEQQLRAEAEAAEKDVERQRLEEEQKALRLAMEARASETAARLQRLQSEWKQSEQLAKAARAGDASAVPRAGERMEDQRFDAVDALFAVGSDEEDIDYNPDQEDDLRPENEQKSIPAASDDEPEADFSDESDEEGFDEKEPGNAEEKERQKNAATASASKKKSRLKKRLRAASDTKALSAEEAGNGVPSFEDETRKEGEEVIKSPDHPNDPKRPRFDAPPSDPRPEDDAAAARAKALFGSDSD